MSRKTIGLIAIIGGLLLTILSLIADYIGIGTYPGINYAQLAGVGIGLLVFALGIWLNRSNIVKEK